MVASPKQRVERQEADLVVPAELAVRWRKGKPDLERKGKPDWVKKPRPQTRAAPTLYSTNLECEQTLKLAVQSLRITGYRMARLLEMRDAHYIRWIVQVLAREGCQVVDIPVGGADIVVVLSRLVGAIGRVLVAAG